MSKVNISEAAKLAGVSRQYFYKKFLTPGFITVERDLTGSKVIDTSEILRVCGKLSDDNVDSQQNVISLHEMTRGKDTEIATLQTELRLLREQLASSSEREKWLQGKVDQLGEQLAITTRLLDHKPPPQTTQDEPVKKKRWWHL